MTIELIILITLGIIIFATIGFYLLLYYRFMGFINKDKDRINAFSEVCYQNLRENTFKEDKEPVKEEKTNLSPVVQESSIVVVDDEEEKDNNITIDDF